MIQEQLSKVHNLLIFREQTELIKILLNLTLILNFSLNFEHFSLSLFNKFKYLAHDLFIFGDQV